MSAATKQPDTHPAPAREYKAHFELWDEANGGRPIIDDADAPPLLNGRRVWNTPVLTVKPFALPPRRRPQPPPVTTRESLLWVSGAMVVGAFLAVIMIRPWEYSTLSAPKMQAEPVARVVVPKPPPKVVAAPRPAPQPAPKMVVALPKAVEKLVIAPIAPVKVVVAPKPIPSVAMSVKQETREPAALSSTVALAAPAKPVAIASMAAVQPKKMASPAAPAEAAIAPPELKPSAAQSSSVASVKVASVPMSKAHAMPTPSGPGAANQAEAPATEDPLDVELAPVHTMLLESAIRTQLAGEGFTNLGVSLNDDGDVFLNGTFLNLADQDKVIAMIRARQGVRDIYFSGTVWHEVTPSDEQVPMPAATAPAPNAASANPATPQQVAKLPPSAPQPATVKHVKIAHSADFPVTAAEVPMQKPTYAAPLATIAPTPAAKAHGLFPFQWLNKLGG